MDAALRTVLRDYARDERTREEALVALARAGISPESLAANTEAGLAWAFIDMLDYFSVDRAATPVPPLASVLDRVEFVARARHSPASIVTVWPPTLDEILAGDFSVRFSVNAPMKERTEVIATIEEAFPLAVVVSAQIAAGKRPPAKLIPSPPGEDALWPAESTRVHVRG